VSEPSKTRAGAVTRAILLVGFAAAAAIYAVNARPGREVYELEKTRLYRHDLEVYGGRANVLADDFRDWFAGLWHGRNLAFTVAALTVVTALAYRFVATAPSAATEGQNDVSASDGTSAKSRPSRP
jgi:hypothetical protein